MGIDFLKIGIIMKKKIQMIDSKSRDQLSSELRTFAKIDDVLFDNIINHYVQLIDDDKFIDLAANCLSRELELEQLSNQA